jgi:hypothetical protein
MRVFDRVRRKQDARVHEGEGEAVRWDRYTKIDGVQLGESAFGDGPALWVNAKQITNDIDADTVEVRVGRKHMKPNGLTPHTKTSDWCVLPAKHTAQLAALIELAASQHRVPNPKPPPSGADMERRRRFH